MKIENLGDLRILIHTARCGSLTAAAGQLGLTPAAASAALKRLENQLGTRLFERSTRAMRLTTQGQTLLDYAARAFELVAEGEAQVAADRADLVGTLRIAAPSDLARTTLLPWLDAFVDQHPAIEIALTIGDRTLDVVRDEVDVAIRYGTLVDSRLVARPLMTARPVVAAAPSYLERHGTPLTPQDLAHHNCLAYDRAGKPHRVWRFQRDGAWTEVRVTGNRRVDDASIARQWAVAGAGILLKSPLEQRQDMERGALVRLLPEWQSESYPLHAVMPSGRFIPARVRAVVDYLAERFSQAEQAGSGV
ncbi:LysR family transcriptional regulator [Tahibacter amnicola]|uniref:LysR family transcriptional regulator n=1 Tax=Tahibacter amnicola TaxID=2976241 RepID=A0ABY6BQ12_9GAMM|nr:LysR family transcriptional regulator [Tahibacter amnicola]UXI70510.1 LysR family transcriptional regulator [Tahibacter amnicola]